MKKKTSTLFVFIAGIIAIVCVLNLEVTTRQGIDYKVQTLKIPLYLKVLDFFDRHYNYKWAVHRITEGAKTDKEKVLKIFKWTCENIKKAPDGYPIIDDHVWHIMVRGYGVADQSSDVFTTLCNYAGSEAFFSTICMKESNSCIFLSFVLVDKEWFLFDPYDGVYFKNKQGNLANIKESMEESWVKASVDNIIQDSGIAKRRVDIDYAAYFRNLPPVVKAGLNRANTQSPINRLKYEIRRRLKRI